MEVFDSDAVWAAVASSYRENHGHYEDSSGRFFENGEYRVVQLPNHTIAYDKLRGEFVFSSMARSFLDFQHTLSVTQEDHNKGQEAKIWFESNLSIAILSGKYRRGYNVDRLRKLNIEGSIGSDDIAYVSRAFFVIQRKIKEGSDSIDGIG